MRRHEYTGNPYPRTPGTLRRMLETGLTTGYIVTESHSETIETDYGTIRCIPAPEFLAEAKFI